MSKKTIAFFDFDGTISRSDSLLPFLRYYFSKSQLRKIVARFIPVFARFKLRLMENGRAKERLFQLAFSGESAEKFNSKCDDFYYRKLRAMMRERALERIEWHLEKGHEVVVVSASVENYLNHFCSEYGLKLIATRLDVKHEKLTGSFATPNCYGIEKVNRIKEVYNLSEFSEVFAYGDSRGDREMLALATKPFFRKFS